MPDIEIMRMADYDALRELWQATPGMGLRSLDDSREGLERFLARNPNTCFAARSAGELVGCILSGHDGRRGYIYHAVVAEQARGQGLGRRLVDRALEALRAEGIHKAALVVFADNAGGNAFWEALGFTRRGDLIYRNRSLNDDNR